MTGASETDTPRLDPEAFSRCIDGVPVVQFKRVTDYTTFTAEYTEDSDTGDLTYHFYRPDDAGYPKSYFEGGFAGALSDVAIKVFGMEYPRLAAAWTPEADSWWLRARGAGLTGNSEMLSRHLFETLDAAVDQALQRPGGAYPALSKR